MEFLHFLHIQLFILSSEGGVILYEDCLKFLLTRSYDGYVVSIVWNHLFQNRLFVEDIKDSPCLRGAISRAGISTARQQFVTDGKLMNRVFAPYTVYKGKAALSASPSLPTFSKLESGGLKIDRRGSIMLTFWPAVGERKYDWEKRQMFALSATEVGSMLSLGSKDSCEFFHDPSMLSRLVFCCPFCTLNAGQVRKSLSIKPLVDGSGYFVSLSKCSFVDNVLDFQKHNCRMDVVNNILKTNERFTVPVTAAEFAVMRTAFSV
ncbi:unnamed protein product [Ilex paraguariensis]|uniref:Uncharacterized protein n=1 Tax=Ilex paraguariensis TaxID=185542 RepID=A0ABC8T586_9AQUA